MFMLIQRRMLTHSFITLSREPNPIRFAFQIVLNFIAIVSERYFSFGLRKYSEMILIISLICPGFSGIV